MNILAKCIKDEPKAKKLTMRIGEETMATEFGNKVQKMRRAAGLTLHDVAQKMSITSAFLSAVENGRKRVPDDFVTRFIQAFPGDVSESESALLEVLANKARKQVILPLGIASTSDVSLATVLARKFDTLSADQKAKIRTIIDNYNPHDKD